MKRAFYFPYIPPQGEVKTNLISIPSRVLYTLHSDGEHVVITLTSPDAAGIVAFSSILPQSAFIPIETVRQSQLTVFGPAWETFTRSFELAREGEIYVVESKGFGLYARRESPNQLSPFFQSLTKTLVAAGGMVRILVEPADPKVYSKVESMYWRGAEKKKVEGDPRARLRVQLLERKIQSQLLQVTAYILSSRIVAEQFLMLATPTAPLQIREELRWGGKLRKSKNVDEFDSLFFTHARSPAIMSLDEFSLLLPLVPYDDKTLLKMPYPPATALPKAKEGVRLGTVVTSKGSVEPVVVDLSDFATGCIVAGLPGSGKSVLTANLALDMFERGANLIFIDPKASLADLFLAAVAKRLPHRLRDVVYIPSDLFPGNFNFFDATRETDLDKKISYWTGELADIFDIRSFGKEKEELYVELIRAGLRLAHIKYEHPNFADFVDAVKSVANPSVVISVADSQLEEIIEQIRGRWSSHSIDEAVKLARKDTAPFIAMMEELLDHKTAMWSFLSREPVTLDEVFTEPGEGPNRALVVRLNPSIPPRSLQILVRLMFSMSFRYARVRANRTTERARRERPLIFIVDEARHIVNFLYDRVSTMVQEGRSLGMWLVAIVQNFWQLKEQAREGGERIRASLYGTTGMSIVFNQKNIPPDVHLPEVVRKHVDMRLPRYNFSATLPYTGPTGENLVLFVNSPPYPDVDERFLVSKGDIRDLRAQSKELRGYLAYVLKRWGGSREVVQERRGGSFIPKITAKSDVDLVKELARAYLRSLEVGELVELRMDGVNAKRAREILEGIENVLGTNLRRRITIRVGT